MTLTPREQKVLQEIREWETSMYDWEANDFQLIYDRYIENAFQRLPDP